MILTWTLLEGRDKAHHLSYDFAFQTVYDEATASRQEIKAEGMIDNQIIVEVLKLHNYPEDLAIQKLEKATFAMKKFYHQHPERGIIKVMPGVVTLLKKLKSLNIPMGLLTGNVESIGWDKVKRAGIKDYFSFGSFGNLALKRIDLIPIARERAERILGERITLNDLFIVGDSPLDIACAKAGGIQVVAVSTGKLSYEELQVVHPDLLLHSLEEKVKFLEFIQDL